MTLLFGIWKSLRERPRQLIRIGEVMASPQLLCKEAHFEHKNSFSNVPKSQLWTSQKTSTASPLTKLPTKPLRLHHGLAIYVDHQAWIIDTDSVTFEHEIVNLTIITKLSLGTEHLLAKNMLPLGNEHNIRFSISYKNSRKIREGEILILKFVFYNVLFCF